jgi:hypothetical protein
MAHDPLASMEMQLRRLLLTAMALAAGALVVALIALGVALLH